MPKFLGDSDYEHGSVEKVGILLVNLGTPEAPTAKAVRPYLREFLSDPRVIEAPKALWWLILNCSVLVTRPKKSAALYREIWTDEGSPLKVITEKITAKLKQNLVQHIGSPLEVEYAMRYGNPSISSVMQKMKDNNVRRILVVPLYPQYSASSSGTVFDAVAKELTNWRWVPELRTVMQYHDHPGYISSLASSVRERWDKEGMPEKLVMSFHGFPRSYLDNGDPYHCHCQKTARLLAEKLGIAEDFYMVTFQSLFGKEEWIRPYTDETMEALAKFGLKKLDVICPGFSADCLETLEEIEAENKDIFIEHGGEQFRYIPALNDRPDIIQALSDISLTNLSGWITPAYKWDAQPMNEEAEASGCRYAAMNEK